MQIIYLILAHTAPSQLLRLVDALNEPDAAFVVHVDKRVSKYSFEILFKGSNVNIHFIKKRCESRWGSFELVQASLNCLRFIQRKYGNAQRVVFLSGLDYPIKPVIYIKKYLKNHPDTIFMRYFSIPYNKWPQQGTTRFPLYEEVRAMMELYGGSQWLSFPVYLIEVIFEFIKLNEDFLEYFKQAVAIPDESFFQTLFFNCGITDIVKNIVNHNLHLIKWDNPYMHPRILTLRDTNIIKRSKALFARKFDNDQSIEILDWVDRHISITDPKMQRIMHSSASVRQMNSAIIMLTNEITPEILDKLASFQKAGDGYHVFLLYHQTEPQHSNITLPHGVNIHTFGDEIIRNSAYTALGQQLVPGNNHFPLLQFYHKNPNFDFYWYIEDDVFFNGAWDTFFGFFSRDKISADFISSHIQDYAEVPEWFWWNSIYHTSKTIPANQRIRSFNPIYRISNGALKCIHKCLLDGWSGHHEVFIPTMLVQNGLSISDLGGAGRYTTSQCRNKFYTSGSIDKKGLLNSGSFRFRPIIQAQEISQPHLYHPVKNSKSKDWQLTYDEKKK